jgi:phage tail-like protein
MAIVRHDPYATYNFRVTTDGLEASFAEVQVPTAEIEVVEYREGGDRTNSVRRVPGVTKYSNLVLKRGIAGSTELWEWFTSIRNGELQRRTVVVALLNERRDPVLTYTLRNCLPVKYVGPTLQAAATEVAIEEVELLVEGMEIE